nr:hypothetical protein [uncultured Arsenicibacter sp.]
MIKPTFWYEAGRFLLGCLLIVLANYAVEYTFDWYNGEPFTRPRLTSGIPLFVVYWILWRKRKKKPHQSQ